MIKELHERERRESLKKIVRKEEAKLLAIQTTANPTSPRQARAPPVHVELTPERTSLISTSLIPEALRPPIGYRYHI